MHEPLLTSLDVDMQIARCQVRNQKFTLRRLPHPLLPRPREGRHSRRPRLRLLLPRLRRYLQKLCSSERDVSATPRAQIRIRGSSESRPLPLHLRRHQSLRNTQGSESRLDPPYLYRKAGVAWTASTTVERII